MPVIGTRTGITAEVAPGKRITIAEPEPLPRYVIAEAVPLGGGTYRIVPRLATNWISLSQGSLARLGITLSENTMRRLGRAGFIRIRAISPARYEFELQSWFQHCAATEADEEFWSREVPTHAGKRTNLARYQEAL